MSETQTAFGAHVWKQDREMNEMIKLESTLREIDQIVIEKGLPSRFEGLIIWLKRQGV